MQISLTNLSAWQDGWIGTEIHNGSTPSYSVYLVAKSENKMPFQLNNIKISLSSAQIICFGYTLESPRQYLLEAPRRGASNVYLQHVIGLE